MLKSQLTGYGKKMLPSSTCTDSLVGVEWIFSDLRNRADNEDYLLTFGLVHREYEKGRNLSFPLSPLLFLIRPGKISYQVSVTTCIEEVCIHLPFLSQKFCIFTFFPSCNSTSNITCYTSKCIRILADSESGHQNATNVFICEVFLTFLTTTFIHDYLAEILILFEKEINLQKYLFLLRTNKLYSSNCQHISLLRICF